MSMNNSGESNSEQISSAPSSEAAPTKRGRKAKEVTDTAPKKTPHLAKVEKFQASLPALSDEAGEVMEVARGLNTADIGVLIAHLTAETRIRGVNASTIAYQVGQTVRIVSGPTKFLGREGIVSKSQRIRAYVDFEGSDKPGYFFHSDLEPVGEVIQTESLVDITEETQTSGELLEAPAATGTDG
jgi:hypothetical protein